MNSFLLLLCSLAVVFSATLHYGPRELSIRATASLAQAPSGTSHMEKPQSEDPSTAKSALKEFFDSFDASLKTVKKLSTPSDSPSEDELETFFGALLESITVLKTAVANIDSLGGIDKADVSGFFKTSTENITKLKGSLENADDKPEAVHAYFTALDNNINALKTPREALTAAEANFDLANFFVLLNEQTTKLEAELSK